jgi:hypothetical protein
MDPLTRDGGLGGCDAVEMDRRVMVVVVVWCGVMMMMIG